MKGIFTIITLTLLLLLNACGVRQPFSSPREEPPCFIDQQKQLKWQEIPAVDSLELLPAVGTTLLPARYRVFRLAQAALIEQTRRWKLEKTDTIRLSLPLPEAPFCQEFKVWGSGTLSEELSRKFPDLVSWKGISTDGRKTEVRIDFDGKHLSAEVGRNQQTYIISSWPAASGTVYLVYLKRDSGVRTQPRRQQ